MDRRSFVKLAASAPLALAAGPAISMAGASGGRRLVIVELVGGNDGLGMVPPVEAGAHAALAAMRPTLGLASGAALKLDEQVGFNPALATLMYAWDGGELAVVQGVGDTAAPQDHLRAAAFWDEGGVGGGAGQGWLARLLAGSPPAGALAQAAILGMGAAGPMEGAGDQAARLMPHALLVQEAQESDRLRSRSGTSAPLKHLIGLRDERQARANRVQEAVARSAEVKTRFPQTSVGQQLGLVARAIVAQVQVPVYKVVHRGFDTHAGQRGVHDRLLVELAEGLAALRSELLRADLWGQVMVMTISEFGRRPRENKAGGTDHGTSAPHLVLGGAIKGGLHGKQPGLDDLLGEDLRHGVELGAYLGSAASWLGLDPAVIWPRQRPLALF